MLPRVSSEYGGQEARLAAYSALKKYDTDAWLAFYLQHQSGLVDWEDGMLFKDVRSLNLDSLKRTSRLRSALTF